MVNATLQTRSSALGIASLAMAMAVIVLVGGVVFSGSRWQAGTLYIVADYRGHLALVYLCAAVCLLGFVFGVETFRRSANYKVIGIIGALLNVSLLTALAARPKVAEFLSGPISCF